MLYRIFLIFSLLYIPLNAQNNTEHSIIIIGAGLSGYAAARKLLENGYKNITILEAENRIGGRILSIPFADGMIDSGAQWVHGENGNSIFELVSPHFKFGSTPFDLDPLFVLSNGTTPEQDNFQTLFEVGHKIYEDLNENRPARESFGDLFVRNYENKVSGKEFQHIDAETKSFVMQEMHKDINGDFGSPSWFNISAILNYQTESADGDQYLTWKKSGFITVFDFLTKKAPNKSEYLDIDGRVLLNKTVTNIQYNTISSSNMTIVTCSDGTSYTGKHVIFTGSLGVLKKYHPSLFTPALPRTKVNAIETIQMGNAAKFFMEFDRPFWITPGVPFLRFATMWRDEHRLEAIALNRSYLIDVVGIYAVDQYPNLLEVFLVSDKIAEFELASDEKVTEDIMWVLEKFVPKLKPIPRPLAVHKTKWLTHENFLGGYTYPSMTQQNSGARFSHLAEAITDGDGMPVILFAGEATSSEFSSTANGAVDSGFRAADEIIDYYNSNSRIFAAPMLVLGFLLVSLI